MPNKNIYLSNETLRNMSDEKALAIKESSLSFKGFKQEIALIKAIIQKESMDYQFAYRIDHSVLKKQKWYIKTLTPNQRKHMECWASYGYMQVLFGLAQSYGYNGSPIGLMNPKTNIYYGCKHLRYLSRRYKGVILDMIHAYNWGTNAWMDYDHDGIKDPGEPYKNQKYVDEVYGYFEKFGGEL